MEAGAGRDTPRSGRLDRLAGRAAPFAGWVGPLLLTALAFALYSRNLDDYFLADDFELIHSLYGKGLGYLAGLLVYNESGDAWKHLGLDPDTGGYLRPLKIWLLALDFSLWGTRSTGFHVTATAAFAGTLVTVYGIALALLGRGHRLLAFVAAGVTALHPVFGHVVPSITFREETLSCGLGLAAVWSFVRHRKQGAPIWQTCVFLALALLSKESGISAVLLIGGFDVATVATSAEARHDLLRLARSYLGIGAVVIAYLTLRMIAFGNPIGGWQDPELSLGASADYLATLVRSFFHPALFAPSGVPFIGPAVGVLCVALLAAAVSRGAPDRDDWRNLLFVGPLWLLGASFVNLGTYFDPRHHILIVVGFFLTLVVLLEWATRKSSVAIKGSALFLVFGVASLAFLPTVQKLSIEFDDASRAVSRIRKKIEKRTAHLEPNCAVLLVGVPIYEVPPYYFGWGLQSALSRPFTESDLANRCLVVSDADLRVNRRQIVRPASYDVTLRFNKDWPDIRRYEWR